MCIMSTPKPKVEKIAPAPTPVTETDAAAVNNRITDEAERQRRKRGYAATRVADDRAVLTDNAQPGNRQTLG